MQMFIKYLYSLAEGTTTGHMVDIPDESPNTAGQLQRLETIYKILEMYCWLSYRYEEVFVGRAQALKAQEKCLALIEKGLLKGTNIQRGHYERRIFQNDDKRVRVKRRRMKILRELRNYGVDDEIEDY